jgi:hypothetical protein
MSIRPGVGTRHCRVPTGVHESFKIAIKGWGTGKKHKLGDEISDLAGVHPIIYLVEKYKIYCFNGRNLN